MATKRTPLVSEAIEDFLNDSMEGWADSTLRQYRSVLGRFAAHVGPMQTGRLRVDHCHEFLLALRRNNSRGEKSQTNTVKVATTMLRMFVRYSSRKGWCRGDLVDAPPVMRPDIPRDFLRLSPDELLRMLDQAGHPRDRALLASGMNTGLRGGELTTIKCGDVDLDQGEFFATIHKSRTSDHFPINSDLDREWRSWLSYYSAEVGPLKAGYYLLPSKTGVRWTTGRAFTDDPIRPWRQMTQPQLVVRAGLLRLGYSEDRIKGEGMHTLRRSVGRIYFDTARDTGYDYALRETMAFLHHKNTRTTEIYLGLDVERNRRDTRLKGKPFLTGMVAVTPAITKIG